MPPKPGSKVKVTDLNKDQLTSLATKIARSVNPDPNFISAFLGLIQAESTWRPAIWGFMDAEGIKAGKDRAFGLTQLMATTAALLGVDRFDLTENLTGGARYLLEQLERFGSYELAFAAYNAGPGKVAELGRAPRFPQTIKHWKVAQEDIEARGGWHSVDSAGEPIVMITSPQPRTLAPLPPVPSEGLPRFTPAPGQGVSQTLQAQAPDPLQAALTEFRGDPLGIAVGDLRREEQCGGTQIDPVGQALLQEMLGK